MEIDSLTCSGCKNNFIPEKKEKTCIKCRTRQIQNRELKRKEKENNLQKCEAIMKQNKKCKYFALQDDKYCKKHQNYKKWKEMTNNNINVCSDWIRGCFNIIEEDKYKKCKACREKYGKIDLEVKHKRKEKSLEYNKIEQNNMMCYVCGKIKNKEYFVNQRCTYCYNTYRKTQDNRNKKSAFMIKLYEYKSKCKNNNWDWELLDEEAISLFKENCHYCNEFQQINGIDRVNSDIGYKKNNCIPCCKKCNIMKLNYTKQSFLDIVTYILFVNGSIFPSNEYLQNIDNIKNLFYASQNSKYSKFKYESEKRGLSNDITKEYYETIIKLPCNYCKNYFTNGCQGIDRIDSSISYILTNIVPSCYTCNIMKNIMSKKDFFEKLLQIYNYKILNKDRKVTTDENKIKNNILNLQKQIKPFIHEKFYYDKEYYEKLVFYGDINKINIGIEFVENKKQKDIWNYYRRYVSSLKKKNNSNLIGRQIYGFVKDNNTKTYLGIFSISSDIMCLEDRDNYIEWPTNEKIKNKKINGLMNISTCVPLQPFGYNYNGGKLITAICFSKEICEYFYKKYDDHLLGLTTTSLYGKSIMYSRLPFLKHIGFTKGNSCFNISDEVTSICKDYLKQKGYYYHSKKKFILLQKAFDLLNIPKEDILTDNKKGIYFGFTSKKSKKYLQGKIDKKPNPISELKNINEIYNWWIERWANQRYNFLKENNRLQK